MLASNPADPRTGARRTAIDLALALIATLGLFLLPSVARGQGKGHEIGVMTRNVYLGADLSPAINASGAAQFIEANGQILRDVDTNNFPVRAKGLAQEIQSKAPDLVGLQEVSLWRDGPVDFNAPFTGNYTASHVTYDYLQLLLDQLNKGKEHYRVVFTEPEFDFEAPADYDGNPATGTLGADKNGRLTMRDVILARVGHGVKVERTQGAHYRTLYSPTVAGLVTVHVLRGWEVADVKVRGSGSFRFLNTHLEAFGDPTIREAQAKELVEPGGPATGNLPVVLVGDLNSDDDTVQGGDRLAYNALINAGFSERSTANPLSCCLNTSIITGNLGSVSDFDHQVDHVLTNDPQIKLVNSSVTGRAPVNGYWDSDHAGLFSLLNIHH
jgi:endonuclease/exonuclease/phosphatase family metal-dependent hydrolase